MRAVLATTMNVLANDVVTSGALGYYKSSPPKCPDLSFEPRKNIKGLLRAAFETLEALERARKQLEIRQTDTYRRNLYLVA